MQDTCFHSPVRVRLESFLVRFRYSEGTELISDNLYIRDPTVTQLNPYIGGTRSLSHDNPPGQGL